RAHPATDSSAEHTALGGDAEGPFVVGHVGLADAPDLGWVLAQVLALGPDPGGREEVQLVVGPGAALLDVHRGRPLVDVVHPAQSLREHGAISLDRRAVASLEPVSVVVAAQERALHLAR